MSDTAAAPGPARTVIETPTIVWPGAGRPTPAPLAALRCPNCGSAADKSLVLSIDIPWLDNASKNLNVLHCPECDCRFYDRQVPPDYSIISQDDLGRVPFYVQQGAGVSLITRPLAQAAAPPGSAYMEVGCGYGFGLDYALHARGWRGVGIDPAPLAADGRDALGLPIELRYLRDDDEALGTVDVVLGSEVIEHVTSPSAFVRTLRAMLRPGGLMMLTTPNGDEISPGTPPGVLGPLLSPSLHMVIQSSRSLAALLRQAGFAHVSVEPDSYSLVAYASDAPLALNRDREQTRLALRQYLERRAAAFDPVTDPFLGFAGRAFGECVNDADMAGADRAWAMLVPACRARFGLDLEAPVLPDELAHCTLQRMAEIVPLNLGGLLYARGIRLLAGGTARAALEDMFAHAATAAAAMRRALGELAMEDGQTEDIGWTAAAEAVLCAAAKDVPDIAERLARLPPAPTGGAARRLGIVQRAVGLMVNAGQYALAQGVADRELAGVAFEEPLSDGSRDALFALAILDVQAGGTDAARMARAGRRFAQARAATPPGSDLWWAAYRGEMQAHDALGDEAAAVGLIEQGVAAGSGPAMGHAELGRLVNAGRYEAARTLVQRSGLDRAPFARPGSMGPLTAEERDTLFFLAVLDAEMTPDGRAMGEPAAARQRFSRVRAACEPGNGLWWAALRGELQALDLLDAGAEAAGLVREVQDAHPDLPLPDEVQERFAVVAGATAA